MTVLMVMYPNAPGKTFDADYYREKHMPMVQRVLGPGCLGVGYSSGVSGAEAGSAAPYVAIATLYFESPAAFEATFPPRAAELMADIPNYTDIEPVVQLGEVQMHDIPQAARL